MLLNTLQCTGQAFTSYPAQNISRNNGSWPGLRPIWGSDVRNFPGASAVKNPPANAEDKGSIPDPGRPHMPWGN